MNRLTQLLGEETPVIFDGGMGTLLQERGLEGGGAGELWNLEHPDVIRKIHTEYAEAGAQVLTTNTFGGTEPRLAMHGLGDRVYDVNKAAAALASEVARQHGCVVAGDLGPTGELMFPMGTMDEAQATALFSAQLAGLVDGGIDLVVIETMSDLAEVRAAVAAVQQVAPDLPVVATLSFDTNLHTMMGVAPAQAVTELAGTGVDAVGANCGRGLDELESIMAAMADVRPEGLLLVGQSNAGLPHLVGDRFVYDASVDDVAAHAVRLRDLGIDMIGSCCGSTPAFTAAICAAVKP
jgi:5-methyltetrahydrofolate--homocysteine methyltransferase